MRFLCLYVHEAKQLTRLTSTAKKTLIIGYQELVYWNEVLKIVLSVHFPASPQLPRGFFTTFLYALYWSLEWAVCKFDSSTEVQRSFVQPPRLTLSRMVLRHAT